MNRFPQSPRLRKGGTELFDAQTAVVPRIIAWQYYPDTRRCSLQAKGAGMESGDRLEALRLNRLPVEPVELNAKIPAGEGRNP
jgi:hypothetical protein